MRTPLAVVQKGRTGVPLLGGNRWRGLLEHTSGEDERKNEAQREVDGKRIIIKEL